MEENGKLIGKGFAIIASPILAWILISNVLVVAGLAGINILFFILCSVGFIFTIFYSFYVLWAPKDIFTTIIEPSTVKFIGYNGKPIKTLDENGLFGGWRWVGLYPFKQILSVTFEKWYSVEQTEKGVKLIEHPERIVNYISTKIYSYASQVVDAETAISREPITIHFIVVAQVTAENAMKFAFGIKNPLGTVTSKIRVAIRDEILRTSYDELFNTTISKTAVREEFGQKIFNGLKEKAADKIIASFKDDYALVCYSIGIIDIEPKDKEANKRKFLAERDREAQLIEANTYAETTVTRAGGQKKAAELIAAGNSNARVAEIVDVAKGIFFANTTLSAADIGFAIQNSPELEKKYSELWKFCIEKALTGYKLGQGGYYQLETNDSGSGGIASSVFQALLASKVVENAPFLTSKPPTPEESPVKGKNKASKNTKESFTEEALLALNMRGLSPEETMKFFKENGVFDEDAQDAFEERGLDYNNIKNIVQ
ncbi:MAG: hypothetical protein WCX30_00955 [Candidatus Paceibacterota bacterium]|jgi:regulator of protease activity HflC (stomatin/prohibitin superfamily)|nr:hypothetical protein [bacterium]